MESISAFVGSLPITSDVIRRTADTKSKAFFIMELFCFIII